MMKWFPICFAATLRAWFAAHPDTQLRLVPVIDGFFVVTR